MKGKAIYCPSGKAAEYSYWAVNFYNGCSANCDYCYCKRGVLSSLWSTTPTLKKSLEDETKALSIFMREVDKNLSELQEHGLFFNFTSDPFLKETINLNLEAMDYCYIMDIPVKALTKQTWWINDYILPDNVTIGFTLTGMDDMEPGAASTEERIEAMKYFREDGYKVWASIEPVVDLVKAIKVVSDSAPYVSHYKIGPMSGKKFEPGMVNLFMNNINQAITDSTVYWKEGFIEKYDIDRNTLPENCVDRDYRWWA